ncbi:amyloid-beta A4 precursor protein-binding family A member 1-like [Styela clava]
MNTVADDQPDPVAGDEESVIDHNGVIASQGNLIIPEELEKTKDEPFENNVEIAQTNSQTFEESKVRSDINMTFVATGATNAIDYEDVLKSALGKISVLDNACEDNLHGLSIESSAEHGTATENVSSQNVENDGSYDSDTLDGKTDRINPFNLAGKQSVVPQSPEHNKSIGKFMPLESFGNDEIAGSFIQHGNDATFDHASEIVNAKDESFSNHSENKSASSSQHKEMNHPSYSTPPIASTSDPWVKLPSDPVTENESSQISEKVSDSENVQDSLSSSQNSINNSDIGLKKAPAIENSVSLNPLVLDIPGPCEPEDLIEGIIFSANYLGTTQLASNRNAAKNTRMLQAQEAVNRIKAPDGESQPTVEVDLFISTSKIKILNADTQETMMGHTLRSISYIADVGDLLVIMAKRHSSNDENPDDENASRKEPNKRQRIICHVLSSSDSHLIAESIGQCFNVAYQQFLQSNCIEPQNLTQADFNKLLDTQEMYHDDLVHYSKQENVKEIWVEKKKGEAMGIAIVESGWGSIIPTVILANLQHGSPIERNGKFSIGDQIMAINSTSLVGLPLLTCHSIIKGLRNQTLVKLNIVSCPPVVSVLIKRPDLKHQLGFSVDNGIICSLMRGGIAERGGVRVGHRIIEINNQSVVATPHDKIVQMLVTSVGEIQMKTMPAAMYRLLTGQEQPIYL